MLELEFATTSSPGALSGLTVAALPQALTFLARAPHMELSSPADLPGEFRVFFEPSVSMSLRVECVDGPFPSLAPSPLCAPHPSFPCCLQVFPPQVTLHPSHSSTQC